MVGNENIMTDPLLAEPFFYPNSVNTMSGSLGRS